MCILHVIKKIDTCHFYRLDWGNQIGGKLCLIIYKRVVGYCY